MMRGGVVSTVARRSVQSAFTTSRPGSVPLAPALPQFWQVTRDVFDRTTAPANRMRNAAARSSGWKVTCIEAHFDVNCGTSSGLTAATARTTSSVIADQPGSTLT